MNINYLHCLNLLVIEKELAKKLMQAENKPGVPRNPSNEDFVR